MGVLYRTTVHAEGGRGGRVRSTDGLLELDLAMPKSLGGPENATNPEQLFAAGYAACFASSVEFLVRRDKLPVTDVAVDATVTLRSTEAGPFVLDLVLLTTVKGLPQPQAEDLVKQAHAVCPYSSATRGNIEVELRTEVA